MQCQFPTTILFLLVFGFSQAFGQTISFTSESLVAIQPSGDLYALGQVKKYLPSNVKEYSPFRKVEILMVGGSEYILALTDSGQLHCWGKIGLKDESNWILSLGQSDWILNVDNFDCSPLGLLIHYRDDTLLYEDFLSDDGAQKEERLQRIRNELAQLHGNVCDISTSMDGITILTCEEKLIRIPILSSSLSFVPPQVQSTISNIESSMMGVFVTTHAGQMIYWNEDLFDATFMDHTGGSYGLQENLEALDVEISSIQDIWILTKKGSVKRLNGMYGLGDTDPMSIYNYNPFENYTSIVQMTASRALGEGMIALDEFGGVFYVNPYKDDPTWLKDLSKEVVDDKFTEIVYGIQPPFPIWKIDIGVKIPIGRTKRTRRIFDIVSRNIAIGERRFIGSMRTNPEALIFTSELCTEQGERVSPNDLATMFEFIPPMSELDQALANLESNKSKQSEPETPELETEVAAPNNSVKGEKSITFNKSPKGIVVTTVAVLPIDGVDCNGNNVSGQDIASLTEGSLLGLYDVVERRYLERILDEQRLALSGLLYEQSAVEAGCNVGAEGIIFTEYGCLAGKETIQLKLVDCQTTQLYWSATGVNATAQEILAKVRHELEGQ